MSVAVFPKKVRLPWQFRYHFVRDAEDPVTRRARLESACGLIIAKSEEGNRLVPEPCEACLRALKALADG